MPAETYATETPPVTIERIETTGQGYEAKPDWNLDDLHREYGFEFGREAIAPETENRLMTDLATAGEREAPERRKGSELNLDGRWLELDDEAAGQEVAILARETAIDPDGSMAAHLAAHYEETEGGPGDEEYRAELTAIQHEEDELLADAKGFFEGQREAGRVAEAELASWFREEARPEEKPEPEAQLQEQGERAQMKFESADFSDLSEETETVLYEALAEAEGPPELPEQGERPETEVPHFPETEKERLALETVLESNLEPEAMLDRQREELLRLATLYARADALPLPDKDRDEEGKYTYAGHADERDALRMALEDQVALVRIAEQLVEYQRDLEGFVREVERDGRPHYHELEVTVLAADGERADGFQRWERPQSDVQGLTLREGSRLTVERRAGDGERRLIVTIIQPVTNLEEAYEPSRTAEQLPEQVPQRTEQETRFAAA